jgi:hypothetical protein
MREEGKVVQGEMLGNGLAAGVEYNQDGKNYDHRREA